MAEATRSVFGRSVPRIEDRSLVTGKGRFIDDMHPAGCTAAAFVRSPHAHARFTRIDTLAAQAMPGVHAVLTMAELLPLLSSPRLSVGLPSAAIELQVDRPVLADLEVVHVGEAIALVIADTRAQAEDAAELVEADFTPLPAVTDCREALEQTSPTVHLDQPHNRLATFGFEFGDITEAFRNAAVTVTDVYKVHRGVAHSLEGRGVLATANPIDGRLAVYSSTQTPQALKKVLCDLLRKNEDQIGVYTPDLGGGFGPKLITYPEEIAVAAAALLTGRPIKWIEDRYEHFVASTQERDQVWDMSMALDSDGSILGIRGSMVHDHGAYTARGLNIPYGAGVTVPLPYNIAAYKLDIAVALTNKVPTAPIRGAGQPQGAFVMERLLDKAARALKLERTEIRRRNLVRADQMPCEKPLKLRGGTNIILDSGDYPATMEAALQRADWSGFAARRAESRASGLHRGIGIANYVEATGRGPYEGVHVEVNRNGRIVVTTGATAMGQGTATMLAQIVAEQLGGDISTISVRTGDTETPLGFGGFNSRQTVVAGASAHAASLKVRDKLLRVAGHMLEADFDDLDVAPGCVALKADKETNVTFANLARTATGLPGFSLPGLDVPGITAHEHVVIDDMTYSNGTAIAEVDVDCETGAVTVLSFILAHDCGRMINPMLVDGQIVGGIAHGLGNALFEEMRYDSDGQPLTTTLADYLLMTTAEMPSVDILHTESPSPLNQLGVKGVGESGVIPVLPAIASAIDNALIDRNIHVTQMPLFPPALQAMIQQAAHGEDMS